MPGKTEWFEPKEQPVRPGIYEVDYGQMEDPKEGHQYQYWNGCKWLFGSYSVKETQLLYDVYVRDEAIFRRHWRGITEEEYLKRVAQFV